MQKLKSWLFPLLAGGVGALYFSFNGSSPNYTPTLTVIEPTSGIEYRYHVEGLPTVSGSSAGVRIFLSHGDGTYFEGDSADIEAHTHRYPEGNKSYTAYAECTAIYDDNDNPPKRSMTVQVQVPTGLGSGVYESISLGDDYVRLLRNRDAVPGDSIVYIATYSHDKHSCAADTLNGILKFEFDNSLFQLCGVEMFNGESIIETNTSTSVGFVRCTIPALYPNQQRNIFFVLETRDDASTNATMSPFPNVFYSASGPSCGGISDSDMISGQTVRNAHDPNYKTTIQNNLNSGDGYLTWRIDFQNEGNAKETSVLIVDWIDPLLDYSTVELLEKSVGGVDILVQTNELQRFPLRREVRVQLTGIELRGLKERAFPEHRTRGYVKLRAKRQTTLPPCTAIVNRARIHFNCNPPIFTTETIDGISCAGPSPVDTSGDPPPPLIIMPSDSCAVVLDTTTPPVVDTVLTGKHLLDGLGNEPWYATVSDMAHWKWYPTDGLDNPFALNPALTKTVYHTYVLVASDPNPCRRAIVRVPVRSDCNLSLDVQQTAPDCQKWNVHVTAQGSASTCLLWQDSTRGLSDITYTNLWPHQIYFSVWDTITGCAVEKWVQIGQNRLQVFDDPGNCRANLVIAGGTPPYSVLWNYKDEQNAPKTATGPRLGLNGKTEVKGTVTDANGCIVTIRPHRGPCTRSVEPGVIAGVLVAVAAILFFLYRFFKKP